MKFLAVERERLRVAERRAQIVDEFERRRFALAVIEAERAEIIRIDAGHEAELHAAAEHLIDDGDFLGEPQRMIERHDVAHRPDAQSLGARAGADRDTGSATTSSSRRDENDARRRRSDRSRARRTIAVRAKAAHNADAASSGLGPDVGEMREFHDLTVRYCPNPDLANNHIGSGTRATAAPAASARNDSSAITGTGGQGPDAHP